MPNDVSTTVFGRTVRGCGDGRVGRDDAGHVCGALPMPNRDVAASTTATQSGSSQCSSVSRN